MVVRKKRTDWLEQSRAKRLVQITNIKDKIPDFETILPFPKAKKDRLILICETYITLANYIEQTRATMEQLTDYDELIEMAKGGTQGEPAPQFVGFKTLTLPAEAFVGIIIELRELVDDIKHCDNYTRNIGEGLMIVPVEGEDISEQDITPQMKTQPIASTYRVRVEGSLQGLDAVRADWRKKGASVWQIGIGFLTKLPGEITIPAVVQGEPESGELRFIMIDENEPVGQFSLIHSLTVG